MADPDRRKPKQERAVATVDAVIEAAARILIDDGYARLTTNRVAERAGVSVGTLYQYFRSKEAILEALVQRIADERQSVSRELDPGDARHAAGRLPAGALANPA